MAFQRRDLLVAFSLANIALLEVWRLLFFIKPEDSYFIGTMPGRLEHLAALLCVVVLTLLFSGAMSLVRRTGNKPLSYLAKLCFLAVLVPALDVVRRQLPAELGFGRAFRKLTAAGLFWPAVLVLVVLAALMLWKLRLVARGVSTLVLVLWPLAAFNVLRVGAGIATPTSAPPPKPHAKSRPAPPHASGGPKVVVLLFDELDWRALSAELVPMPELKKLLATSLYAERAYPPTDATACAIPSLLTGLHVSRPKPTADQDLRMKLDDGREVLWSEEPNLFSITSSIGKRSAVVGFYHPYCAVLAPALGACHWQPHRTLHPEDGSLVSAMIEQLYTVVPDWHLRHRHVKAYDQEMASSLELLGAPDYDLIYIHAPVPHWPVIYDRESQSITSFNPRGRATGYLDNLALADRAFGELRRTMETSGLWNEAVIIVTSDHRWRSAPFYDRTLDFRVPFIVHSPGQQTPLKIEPPFATLLLKDLVLGALKGELEKPEDFAAFIEGRREAIDWRPRNGWGELLPSTRNGLSSADNALLEARFGPGPDPSTPQPLVEPD